MTTSKVNKDITDMLKQYEYPVSYITYTGSEEKYFTFNFADESGDLFADDAPEFDKYSLQLHFFAPSTYNHNAIKDNVKKLLLDDGWTYPSTYVQYEKDTKLFHIVWTAERNYYRHG